MEDVRDLFEIGIWEGLPLEVMDFVLIRLGFFVLFLFMEMMMLQLLEF